MTIISLTVLAEMGFAQQFLPASSPKLLSIDSDNEIQLTLSPQKHNLLGLFIGQDSLIEAFEVSSLNKFSVWVQGKLYRPDSNYHKLSLAEISKISGNTDTAFVAFYSKSNFKNFESRYLLRKNDNDTKEKEKIRIRSGFESRDTFVVFFLFFLVLLGVFRLISRDGFFSYFNKVFFRSLRISTFEENSSLILFEAIIASFLVGLSIWHIINGKSVFLPNYFLDQTINVLKYSAYAGGFLVFKYLLLRIISYLNGLKDIYLVQFTDFLKYLLVGSILLNVVFFSIYWLDSTPSNYLSNNWQYFYPFIYLIFISYYFFKLSAAVPGKKILIISYLCSTEIIGAYIVASILIN